MSYDFNGPLNRPLTSSRVNVEDTWAGSLIRGTARGVAEGGADTVTRSIGTSSPLLSAPGRPGAPVPLA